MRWYEAKVYALKEVGRDVLGTVVCEPELAGAVLVRPTPWSTEAGGENDGNAYDYVRRTFFSRAPRGAFSHAAYIEAMGERYAVKELSSAMGMTLIVAELYKVEP